MAKKRKPQQQQVPNRPGRSKPESFTHGMISDLDPRFQLEGSYSDAQNIRLTNSEGDTFTVENIEGNSLFVDLANFGITPASQPQYSSYPTFWDRGPTVGQWSDIRTNYKIDNRCSIVGHVSYANQLLLVIVGRFDYESEKNTSATAKTADRTIFLLVDFDHNFTVKRVTDLMVCFYASGSNYPDLNMDLDVPIRMEHIVENDSISRVYWTDNKNPLRTFNIKDEMWNVEPTSLDITPLMNPSKPTLSMTLHGSLPVGVYQYAYKYISENGGESTFSPLSNMYHVSDQAFSSSQTYAGGPKGNLGTQGFQIDVNDVDQNFAYIEMYSLLYDEKDTPPRVAVIARNQISGSSATFQHTVWNNEVENGLEEILIESNTFDVCKDIAIKDNILFAANLRQKRNFISEQEWNVKVLRWRIAPSSSSKLDAMLTTNDPQVKHYQDTGSGPTQINTALYQYDVTDDNGDRCGYGQLLGAAGSMYPSTSSSMDHINYDGTLNVPMWTTALSNQRGSKGGDNSKYPTLFTYRFLPDRMTLGAESFNYRTNGLGGCRISFGVEKKVADQSQNAYDAPFISATTTGEDLITENNGNTVFKTSMNLGGSKDPHLAGDKRGYQRGDIYRFGVQIYDLNGAPGNVLWIGDIETPHQHDLLRMINIKNKTVVGGLNYNPLRPTLGTGPGGETNLVDAKQIISGTFFRDHRLSHVYGHTVPPVDIEWFTGRNSTNSYTNKNAYIQSDGQVVNDARNPAATVASNFKFNNDIIKATPLAPYHFAGNHDDTHYLFDLYVAFEFIIPDAVVKKISGFRVVRAKRNEEDRRIVQQGILNQTAQYGNAQLGQKYGYDDTKFSQKDNEMFDDDPVFVNQSMDKDAFATLPEQPEYNVYLNGYLGLAENSHAAFFDDATNTGKATAGGNLGSKTFFWPEREDVAKYLTGANGPVHARNTGDNVGSLGGPGTQGRHRRHCMYFGSYDKRAQFSNGTDGLQSNLPSNHSQVSGSIFTLDSPDSAFGIRPYVYREGDMLRIDCSMKLTNEVRYTNGPNTWNDQYGHGAFRHGTATIKSSAPNTVHNDWDQNGGTQEWAPKLTNQTHKESLAFATSKKIDDHYRVLVGKYYCYDPYFGIGMEVDGGKHAAIGNTGANSDAYQSPKQAYGWQLPIASSKEISDGEIVPSGFFKVSKRVKEGYVNGFSNNTLGYVKTAQYTAASANPGKKYYWVFGSVNKGLAHVYDFDTDYKILSDPRDPKKQDFSYDTVSTVQMGLRSILLEVDTRTSVVRKYSATNTYFDSPSSNVAPSNNTYDSWFAPLNLSALFEHGDWRGKDSSGANLIAGFRPYMSGYLTRSNIGGYHSGHGNEDHGQGTHTFSIDMKSYVPFKYLCSIVRQITPYGGYDKANIEKTRYIPCGNFHPVGESTGGKQGHVSQVFGGDTFVNLYSHQKTSTPYMKHSAARYQVFPVESFVNTDMRSGLTLNAGDTVIGKEMNEPPFSNDWLYNSVYSQENTIKSAITVDEEKFDESLNLPYEIAYSNTKILGQKTDAFRQFPINQFHDMEGLYGEINRIVNFKNEIYVLQDSAFAKLLVNPLSMLSDDAGTSLFTGTGETVENHIYISTKYGSRHRFSVTMSEKSLYFVDSNYGRLFKYDTEKLISLGDAFGQRNYLRYIIKEWEQRVQRPCPSTDAHTQYITHPTLEGLLDSNLKATNSRNYLSDNPLNFLGITSIYDYKNKELMVTFHNSHWTGENKLRQTFARIYDNHTMGSTIDGSPVGVSETLVYSEAINAFTSKYSVAPPQWLVGGQGSFVLCPENQINVNSIANFDSETGLDGTHTSRPYDIFGSRGSIPGLSGVPNKQYRVNPLKLWLWDYHDKKIKNNFFGRKDDILERQDETDLDGNVTKAAVVQAGLQGSKLTADESYIEKIINSEAANSKVFDNVQVVMTPSEVDYSFIDYTTDITHDTITAYNVLDQKTELLDETEQLVINRRWDFKATAHAWRFFDGSTLQGGNAISNPDSVTLTYNAYGSFKSPGDYYQFINVSGKFNNILRVRLKRNSGSSWVGIVQWSGYDPIRAKRGDYTFLTESTSRQKQISEPAGIDDGYVIAEWDMSDVDSWNDCIIRQVDFAFASSGEYEVDWVEIGGLKAHKYIDGVLRAPLRTEKSTKRTRGTYAKIRYTAKTTEKFNIFAILAKYRKTY